MIKCIQIKNNGLYIHYEIHDDELYPEIGNNTKIARFVWCCQKSMILEIAGMLYNNVLIYQHSKYSISLYNIINKSFCEIDIQYDGEIENISSNWL